MLVASGFLMTAMLSCAVQGDYPAPALGVLVDGNLAVVAVLADGAAERAGVQVGDVLETLNGAPLTRVADWRTEVSRIKVGLDYDLTVQRAGQSMTLRVTSLVPPTDTRAPSVTPTVAPTGIYYVRLLPQP